MIANMVSFSSVLLINNKVNEGVNNQNLILFIRGKAISAAPCIRGTINFQIYELY